MTTPAARSHLARLMDYSYRERGRIHYAQVRPMRTRRIHSLHMLQQALALPAGITCDCSESVTMLCHIAGLDDPNGFGYDGTGYTGTLLHHLPHLANARTCKLGDLVVFGPGSGDHVCMVRQSGANPLLWSHGQESGPIFISLRAEDAYQRNPTRFLSIARL